MPINFSFYDTGIPFNKYVFWVLTIAGIVLLRRNKKTNSWKEETLAFFRFEERSLSLSLMALGLIGAILAAFPYQVVHKQGTFESWESRHLLLFTLIAPYFYLGAVKLLTKVVRRNDFLLLTPLMFFFALVTNGFYLSVHLREMYQTGLVEHFKQIGVGPTAQNYFVEDELNNFFISDLKFGFTDYTGMIDLNLGSQKTLLLNHDDVNSINTDPSFLIPLLKNHGRRYKTSDVDFNLPFTEKLLIRNNEPVRPSTIFKYMANREIDREESKRQAMNAIRIERQSVPPWKLPEAIQ